MYSDVFAEMLGELAAIYDSNVILFKIGRKCKEKCSVNVSCMYNVGRKCE